MIKPPHMSEIVALGGPRGDEWEDLAFSGKVTRATVLSTGPCIPPATQQTLRNIPELSGM